MLLSKTVVKQTQAALARLVKWKIEVEKVHRKKGHKKTNKDLYISFSSFPAVFKHTIGYLLLHQQRPLSVKSPRRRKPGSSAVKTCCLVVVVVVVSPQHESVVARWLAEMQATGFSSSHLFCPQSVCPGGQLWETPKLPGTAERGEKKKVNLYLILLIQVGQNAKVNLGTNLGCIKKFN